MGWELVGVGFVSFFVKKKVGGPWPVVPLREIGRLLWLVAHCWGSYFFFGGGGGETDFFSPVGTAGGAVGFLPLRKSQAVRGGGFCPIPEFFLLMFSLRFGWWGRRRWLRLASCRGWTVLPGFGFSCWVAFLFGHHFSFRGGEGETVFGVGCCEDDLFLPYLSVLPLSLGVGRFGSVMCSHFCGVVGFLGGDGEAVRFWLGLSAISIGRS